MKPSFLLCQFNAAKKCYTFCKNSLYGIDPPPFFTTVQKLQYYCERASQSLYFHPVENRCYMRWDMWHCNVAARGVAGTLEGTAAEAARCEWKPLPALSPLACPASVERLGPSSQDATQGMSSIFHSIRVDFQLSALTKPSQCH